VECDIFPALTLLVGDRKGIRPVKNWMLFFVGDDDLTDWSSFLQTGCPSRHPTNSVEALKGNDQC